MDVEVGDFQVLTTARGLSFFQVELAHFGLHKHRIIKGNDLDVVQRKADLQVKQWREQWKNKKAGLDQAQARDKAKLLKEERKQLALTRTDEAQAVIEGLGATLKHTLQRDDTIDWELLKDTSSFPKPPPVLPPPPLQPAPTTIPREPARDDPQYSPRLGLLDRLVKSRSEAKRVEAAERLERDHKAWLRERERILGSNAADAAACQQKMQAHALQHRQAIEEWERDSKAFFSEQQNQNAAIDRQKASYLSGAADAVISYCDLVLSRSEYADFMPQEYELDYNPDNRILLVNYSLPAPSDLPTLIEVKYIASKDEFIEKHLSSNQLSRMYDDLLYQITVRTIHELFEADAIASLSSIAFNGYVMSIDRGTGKEVNACVLSVHVSRQEFEGVDLAHIDPKACFKQLKGVGSSKLHSITPVAPLMTVRRDDGRFISAYEVAHTLTEGVNLAAMEWEDFEHLIRELFEKEFAASGGEVKITRASRDRGVDAVAFDPDPIRGGKTVIQAKRYTNTVDVAAVRDLYGTVMNEGASKGILVTTSDYGPDAYAFAQGKPLVLLSGANLLHLLQKHGHAARIDLREARQLALEQRVQN
jgi:restriction system protein